MVSIARIKGTVKAMGTDVSSVVCCVSPEEKDMSSPTSRLCPRRPDHSGSGDISRYGSLSSLTSCFRIPEVAPYVCPRQPCTPQGASKAEDGFVLLPCRLPPNNSRRRCLALGR
jgi:hypothetical protein